MYNIIRTKKFIKSYERAIKRGLDISLLNGVITKLQKNIPLEEKYKDHKLSGYKDNVRECHIQNDWLLLYVKKEKELVLTLIDTGTHSDIF